MAESVETVRELRAYLEKIESSWTDNDDYHLGKFEDQPIYAMTDYSGYSPAMVTSDVGGEIVIFPKHTNETSK